VRAARRESDELRDVRGQPVQQQHRLRARFASDVNMLTEHGELLGEIPVQPRDVTEARPVVDLAVVPALERMRSTAYHFDVGAIGAYHQCVVNGKKLGA